MRHVIWPLLAPNKLGALHIMAEPVTLFTIPSHFADVDMHKIY